MKFVNKKLEEFNNYIKGKKVAIIGLGVSNIPLIDELYKFLLIICTILILLNTIIKSKIIDIIELIILIISTIRFLSKNKSKRQKENQIYFKIKNKIIKYYQYQKKRYQDHNTHIYRKCPKCKQKIRLPLKKGKHTVKCPNCQHHFIVKCPRNEKIKIEIVK